VVVVLTTIPRLV